MRELLAQIKDKLEFKIFSSPECVQGFFVKPLTV